MCVLVCDTRLCHRHVNAATSAYARTHCSGDTKHYERSHNCTCEPIQWDKAFTGPPHRSM